MNPDYGKIFAEYTGSGPGAVLRRMSEIEKQELRWLWPGRVPLGKLTLFAGDPGLGKSFVTLDIAARVTRGTDWPDGTAACKRGSVIVLSAEDDPGDTIRPRLEAAGADLNNVHVLQAVRRAKPTGEQSLEHFSLEADLFALQDAIVSLSDVRLIVIDPVSAYLGGVDSHVNANVRTLLAPLSAMAAATRVAVVTVTHLNKSNSSALYRASGSVAFVAAARAVWLFAKNPDDAAQRLMLPGKMNLAPEQGGMGYRLEAKRDGAVVVWGGVVSVSAEAVLEPEGTERRSERLEAMDWLRGKLADGPVAQRKLKADAAKEGFAWATVRRAKDAMEITIEKEGFQGASQWSLASAHSKDAQSHITRLSTFEQAIENTNLNGNHTFKDAQPAGVSIIGGFEDGEL